MMLRPFRLLNIAIRSAPFSRLAWWTVFSFLLIPTVEFRNQIAEDIDSSYIFLQNYLIHTPFRFGRDVVFTYGPFGFLILHLNYQNNLIWAILFASLLWALVIGGLWCYLIYFPQQRFSSLTFALLCFVMSNNIYYVFLFLYSAQSILFPVKARHISFSILLAYAVWMLFVKLDIGISSLIICMMILLKYMMEKDISIHQGLMFIAVVPASFILVYWLYNPSVQDLWTYIRSGLDLTSEYGTVLSIGEEPIAFRVGTGFLVIWFILTGWLFFRKQIQTGFLFLMGSMHLWFSYKHGFIRQDYPHWILYFEKIPALFGATALFVSNGTFRRWVMGLGLSAIAVMIWFHVENDNGTIFFQNLFEDRTLVFHLPEALFLLHSAPTTDIPNIPARLRSEIGNRPTTIFPWNASRVFADKLNYVPLFVPQAYQSYTAFLDKQTAMHVEQWPIVPEFVLFDWQRIDDRHPLIDVPYTWLIFYKWYDAKRCDTQLYLVRRDAPRFDRIEPTGETVGRFGEWLNLPSDQHRITVQCNLTKSLLGKLVNGTYRLPPLLMEIVKESGLTIDFRVPPDVLKNPLLIDSLPLTEEDVLAVMDKAIPSIPDSVLRFRLHGDKARSYYQEPFIVSFGRLQ